jgi:lysophospholipid acyltransferase (LPLAT)-like uncharacterized protein
MPKSLKKLGRKILKSRLATALIGFMIFLYSKFVFKTTSWKIEGLDNILKMHERNENFIFLAWHSRTLLLPNFWNRKYRAKALVSKHSDGRLMAGMLRLFGVTTIDGSSSNNAPGAALGIAKALKEGSIVAIIPDGPRGPRQRMGSSPLYFAQKTDVPVIIGTCSVKGAGLARRSWDHMLIPVPFSKGIIMVSEPFRIPENLSDEEFEKYRLKIENKMNEMQDRADDYTGVPRVPPADGIGKKRRNPSCS